MGKVLKVIGAIVLIAVVVFLVAGLFGPKECKLERSTTIHAAPGVIFTNISDYRNWEKWSPWKDKDTNCKYTYSGPQGQADADVKWSGNKEAGEGDMHTTELAQDVNMVYHLSFIRPLKAECIGRFRLDSATAGDTKVTWTFEMQVPFMIRPFMLFNDPEKHVGPDYEKGLAKLKALCESGADAGTPVPPLEIKEVNWDKETYVTYRVSTTMDSLSAIFPALMGKLMGYTKDNKLETGEPVTGLYYSWDTDKKTTDVAVAVPLKKEAKMSGNFKIVTLGSSHAIEADFYGPYEKLGEAHNKINAYIKEKGLKKKAPVIEEYITDPMVEKDSNKWLTKIFYLLD
ncbi:MAG: hypothetical protein JWO03_2171 [Bacteroidetes bacterium]|nr:hypothetical protein [Bacteroidota bacterium]